MRELIGLPALPLRKPVIDVFGEPLFAIDPGEDAFGGETDAGGIGVEQEEPDEEAERGRAVDGASEDEERDGDPGRTDCGDGKVEGYCGGNTPGELIAEPVEQEDVASQEDR